MKSVRKLVAPGLALAALIAAASVFFARSPVLVVTDVPFAELYGQGRIEARRVSASLRLFRRVTPVPIADDAGADMLIAAVSAASPNPFAVLFPRRHAYAARRFHAEFPHARVVLFRGLAPADPPPAGDGFFGVFGTDAVEDMRRAGLMAAIIGSAAVSAEDDDGRSGKSVVLLRGANVGERAGAAFFGAAGGADGAPSVVVVGSAAEMPDARSVSAIVMAGAGADFLERNPGVGVVLFSWIDPAKTPAEVLAVFDDSPWAKVVPAVRLAAAGEASAEIPSKVLVFRGRVADNVVARALRRAARVGP